MIWLSHIWVLYILQVLAEEGLHQYVDARTLQREIAEANDMTQEELERAARMLAQHPHYEHLGGYKPEELRDYNQYSDAGELSRRRTDYDEPSDEQTVYVTTL